MKKYIIRIIDSKEKSKRKLNSDTNYLSCIRLFEKEMFEDIYGSKDKAYFFNSKSLATSIATLVNGKVCDIDGEIVNTEAKQKEKAKINWVNNNPPSLEEVKAYVEKENLNLNYKEWLEYYNKVQWLTKDGKEIINWKQKAKTASMFNDKKGCDYRYKKETKSIEKATEQSNRIAELKKKIGQAETIIRRNENCMLREKHYENEEMYKRAKEFKKKYEEELQQLK